MTARTPLTPPAPAPLVLAGARLLGGDGTPVDVHVAHGRVTAVVPAGTPAPPAGTPADAAAATAAPRVVPLDGRHVAPALRDAHVHMTQWALHRHRLDLSGCTSARAAADLVAAHVAGLVAGARPRVLRVVGQGFKAALWPDAPHRRLLDAACEGAAPGLRVEVVLLATDLHCAWLGTAAAEALGVTAPDGVVREHEAVAVIAAVGRVDPAEGDAAVADAAAAAAALGVVEVVDLEWADTLAHWTRRVHGGLRTLRVHCGVYPDGLDAAVAAGLPTGAAVPGTDGLVVRGPLKIITDGSLNTRTARCCDPYAGGSRPGDGPSAYGELNYPAAEVVRLLRTAREHGLVPAVHAIGDEANRLVLDAFAAVPGPGSIEHAQLLRTDDLHRFAALGVTASVQPVHLLDDRDVADRLWAGRTHRAFAFAALQRAGAHLVFGSDAPVAPLDPWAAMAAAVFRTRDDRAPWHPEHRLDAASAYRASAVGGRLRVREGDPADLVVLDSDPLAAPDAAALAGTRVHLTLLAGRAVHQGEPDPAAP